MNCTEPLQTQAYLDGELNGAQAQAAEAHLQACEECQALAAQIADLSDALRKATRYRAPQALRSRILARLDREPVRSSARSFWFGAASGTMVSAIAAAAIILAIVPPAATTLAQSVAQAHARALTDGQTIAVASSNHHTVKPWLAAHAGLSPPVADFASQGFVLAGGRVDEVAGRPAAVMVYHHGNHELDLFAWPDRGSHLPSSGMSYGFRIRVWKSGDVDFAAVSDVDAQAFQKFVELVQAERE